LLFEIKTIAVPSGAMRAHRITRIAAAEVPGRSEILVRILEDKRRFGLIIQPPISIRQKISLIL